MGNGGKYTALIVYKSFIRSVMDYSSFIYYSRVRKGKETMEKLQYKGVRITLGYRNSTPTNIMISEAKVMKMEERVKYLARNFLIKCVIYGEKRIMDRIEKLTQVSGRHRFKNKRKGLEILIKSWKEIYKKRENMKHNKNLEIYNIDYWTLTDKLMIDINIGRERKKYACKDIELYGKLIEKYDLERDINIIFTDEYKQEGKQSVRIRIVIDREDFSLN